MVAPTPAERPNADSANQTKAEKCSQEVFREFGFVQRHGTLATVVVCGLNPLAEAVRVVSREYGWMVDFEEPFYPSELDYCPTGCMAGATLSSFRSSYREAKNVRTSFAEEEKILRKIVADYNQTSNPGKFAVRKEDDGRYVVVGQSVKMNPGQIQDLTPVLDTQISLPLERRKVFQTIDLILQELKEQSGVVAQPTYPSNANAEIVVGGEDVSARTLLAESLKTPGAKFTWEFYCRPADFRACSLAFAPYYAPAGNLLTERVPPLTYNNARYGISLRYPKHYVLKKGYAELDHWWRLVGSDEGQPPQPDRVTVVTVEMPKDAYPNSTLDSALLNISVNRHLTRRGCRELLDTSSGPVRDRLINGVHFDSTLAGGVLNLGTGLAETDYVAFQNGTCYEITVGEVISGGAYGSGGEDGITLNVDYKDVERRLQAILATVRIRPSKVRSAR